MAETKDKLLVVEDDPGLQSQLKWSFEDFDVTVADERDGALASLRRLEPAVVTLDLGLPPDPGGVTQGFSLLEEILSLAPETKVIVVTGHNDRTNAMRAVGSAHCDPFASMSAAAAALWGPLHGGANEAVVRMLSEIGSKDQIPDLIKRVKSGETRLMGFGHRIYKNYDPRAKIIKQLADEVFDVQGVNPLLEIALELEKIALSDEYFISRKLYP